jgi:hypothetical protein
MLTIIRRATQLASLIGFVFACSVHAETIPATLTETVVSTEQAYYGYGGQPPPYTRFPSARTAANDFFLQPGRVTWQETGFSQLSASIWRVTFNYEHGTAYQDIYKAFGSCPDNSAWNGSACIRQNYVCPAQGGWTLSADQQACSRSDCPAGYERDPATGACLEPCPSGYIRNLSTMQCDIVCDSPLISIPANTCDCPNPLTLIEGNTCIGHDDKEMGDRCEISPKTVP